MHHARGRSTLMIMLLSLPQLCLSDCLVLLYLGLLWCLLQGVLYHYTFLIFTALLLFFWVFTYYFVPETKNKSVEEISALFRQRAYH